MKRFLKSWKKPFKFRPTVYLLLKATNIQSQIRTFRNTAKSFLQTIYSEDLTDFIGSCLEDMDKRPTPEKLMKSRFHRGSQKNLKDDKNSLAEFLKQHFDEEQID
uniref:Uncharacterized protein n=1 Tax=Acrobeloides nanus TaxID=290746 RepID=A0A914CBR1_9BILA